MMRTTALLVFLAAATAAQQPSFQNGHVESRPSGGVERDIAGLAAGAADEPVWVGWRVPMVDGPRNMCDWYSDGSVSVRGWVVDGPAMDRSVPQITPPSGPVPLEAGTGLAVFVRLIDHHVERLRTLGDDCPVDLGGRSMVWLTGVTPASSLSFLDSLTHPDAMGWLSVNARRNLATGAISAIALHRDAAADPILDRIATGDDDSTLRRQAGLQLGSQRGAHGFETIRHLVDTERSPDARLQLVTALGQTRQPGTAEALRTLTRDPDVRIRAEAVYWFAVRGGSAVAPEVTALIDREINDTVKQRAVGGLAQMPKDQSIPLLIQLARTNQSPVVRKEAVRRLGETKDPRAIAFLQELLK